MPSLGLRSRPRPDCLTRPPMEAILRIPLRLLPLVVRMLAFVMEATSSQAQPFTVKLEGSPGTFSLLILQVRDPKPREGM